VTARARRVERAIPDRNHAVALFLAVAPLAGNLEVGAVRDEAGVASMIETPSPPIEAVMTALAASQLARVHVAVTRDAVPRQIDEADRRGVGARVGRPLPVRIRHLRAGRPLVAGPARDLPVAPEERELGPGVVE
jgi:hypothetical protein